MPTAFIANQIFTGKEILDTGEANLRDADLRGADLINANFNIIYIHITRRKTNWI